MSLWRVISEWHHTDSNIISKHDFTLGHNCCHFSRTIGLIFPSITYNLPGYDKKNAKIFMKFCCTVKIYDSAKRTSCLLMAGGSLQQLQEHKHGPVFASHKQYLPYRNISLSTNRTIQVTQSTPKTKDSIKNTYSS